MAGIWGDPFTTAAKVALTLQLAASDFRSLGTLAPSPKAIVLAGVAPNLIDQKAGIASRLVQITCPDRTINRFLVHLQV